MVKLYPYWTGIMNTGTIEMEALTKFVVPSMALQRMDVMYILTHVRSRVILLHTNLLLCTTKVVSLNSRDVATEASDFFLYEWHPGCQIQQLSNFVFVASPDK